MSKRATHTRGPDTPRAAPDTISLHHTEIGGIEVIAREIATGPHPRWGMQHPNTYHYITRLLLADETERYECNHCHLVDPSVDSIKAHLSAHSTKIPQPLTPVPTIRTVLKEVAKARRLYGAGRYATPAAEALNKLGLQPAHGAEWTPQSVSSLYNRYKDEYPVRQPPPVAAPKPPVPRQPERLEKVAGTGEPVDRALSALSAAAAAIQVAQELLRQVEPTVYLADPELVEKAKKYDQMRGLFG